MKTKTMKNKFFKNIVAALTLMAIIGCVFTSCDNSEEELLQPIIENVEIGLGNNEIGVVGRDFHFEMDVLAGDLIENIQVRIEPRVGETYASEWSYEVIWNQYQGLKNTNVHKHFDIPEDAVEGVYDFIITVNDQNGTRLEEVRTIKIYLAENLPIDPVLSIFNLDRNRKRIYSEGEFSSTEENPNILNKNDSFSSQATISGVKGNGIMYLLLIKKSLNHRPESVDEIDFSKVIVRDVYEHNDEESVYDFSNFNFDLETFSIIRDIPQFTIGDAEDLNVPASPITGDKAWASGNYYFGVIYQNTTYNMGLFKYIELEVKGF